VNPIDAQCDGGGFAARWKVGIGFKE